MRIWLIILLFACPLFAAQNTPRSTGLTPVGEITSFSDTQAYFEELYITVDKLWRALRGEIENIVVDVIEEGDVFQSCCVGSASGTFTFDEAFDTSDPCNPVYVHEVHPSLSSGIDYVMVVVARDALPNDIYFHSNKSESIWSSSGNYHWSTASAEDSQTSNVGAVAIFHPFPQSELADYFTVDISDISDKYAGLNASNPTYYWLAQGQ